MPTVIETCVGLALLYLLASLLVGAVVEYISAVLKMRGRVLKDALRTILGDEQLVLDHPLVRPTKTVRTNGNWIDSLSRLAQQDVPALSYVHPRLLALALLSPTTARPISANSPAQELLTAVKTSPEVQAASPIEQKVAFADALERWFGDAMSRWSGVYMRQTQAVSLLICIVLVPLLNIDSVTVATRLWNSPELRMSLATQAAEVLKTQGQTSLGSDGSTTQPVDLARAAVDALGLPLGWSGDAGPWTWWRLLGWLISIVAIAAGSKFWFGTLNRLTNLRLTGPPPTTTPGRSQ